MGLGELLDSGFKGGREITVKAKAADGSTKEIRATVEIDTPQEILYYKHGGILPYVLRQLLAQGDEADEGTRPPSTADGGQDMPTRMSDLKIEELKAGNGQESEGG